MGNNPQRSPDTSAPKGRPLSFDFSAFNPKNSIIYSLIPSIVQNRLPRLGSTSRNACAYGFDSDIEEEDRILDNGNKTFPSGHRSEIVLRDINSSPEPRDLANYIEQQPGVQDDKPGQARSNQRCLDSGIDWKFANQGLNLLSLSAEESATLSQNPTYGNPSFARQLYLHGLTYLLRGLPGDLTQEEQLSIQGSLPRKLLISQELDTSNHSSQANLYPTNTPPPPSILHKILASTIVQLFIIVQVLLPYLKILLRTAYEYERTHHISEKVLKSSVEVADNVGKGRVGQALNDAASWLIEGITGGIHEGVGEGLNIIGAKKTASEE